MKRALLLALLLGACTTATEPVSLGDGRYMIATTTRGGLKSNGELKAGTIQAAQAFCSKDGKKAVIADASARGAQGWTPQNTEVVFTCS
ncbi:MAG: hypothetical protein Q7T61_01100 [Caulobacter sp.]|nr:hypothetical protein [Caulobacter sp.]